MVRRTLLSLARSGRAKQLVTTMPISSGIVSRFVAGETTAAACQTTGTLVDSGLAVSLDRLGEDIRDEAQAEATVGAYIGLLDELAVAGLTPPAEVSVKLSAVGQSLPGDGERLALEGARRICQAARNAGTTVTLDMEDHTTTDSTLSVVHELRQDFPETGAVLQAYLRRTESDCRELAVAGSRVRLCKGAYDEPASVAFPGKADVDKSYVRCLKILMSGEGYPMVATHDPRLVEIAGTLAQQEGRAPGDFEYQMLFGIRPQEQQRLATAGHLVRVYVPYGQEWYGYLMRRLAERPANIAFFARSLVSRS